LDQWGYDVTFDDVGGQINHHNPEREVRVLREREEHRRYCRHDRTNVWNEREDHGKYTKRHGHRSADKQQPDSRDSAYEHHGNQLASNPPPERGSNAIQQIGSTPA